MCLRAVDYGLKGSLLGRLYVMYKHELTKKLVVNCDGSKLRLITRNTICFYYYKIRVSTFTLFPLICHPGSRAVNSILMSSSLLDTNNPARAVNRLFPISSSFWQTCCSSKRSDNAKPNYKSLHV